MQSVAFSYQSCNPMPYNTVSHFFTYGYSKSVSVCIIFHNIHYQIFICVGLTSSINFLKIPVFFNRINISHTNPHLCVQFFCTRSYFLFSHIQNIKEEKKLKNPVLVICPTTLIGNWMKELQMFAPSLSVTTYHGLDRKLDLTKDIILTTYAIMRIDVEEMKKQLWGMIIVDEAQNIKNPDTAQTIAIKVLKSDIKIAMTGTPVENRLTELWSIFDFINKGYLGSLKEFQKSYAIPIERFKEKSRASKLKLSVSPFVLRRLKTRDIL